MHVHPLYSGPAGVTADVSTEGANQKIAVLGVFSDVRDRFAHISWVLNKLP
jgi:hypothetical protein